jgi:hypothetical protein
VQDRRKGGRTVDAWPPYLPRILRSGESAAWRTTEIHSTTSGAGRALARLGDERRTYILVRIELHGIKWPPAACCRWDPDLIHLWTSLYKTSVWSHGRPCVPSRPSVQKWYIRGFVIPIRASARGELSLLQRALLVSTNSSETGAME